MAIQKIKEALPNTINPTRRLPQNPSPAKPCLTSALVILDYRPDEENGNDPVCVSFNPLGPFHALLADACGTVGGIRREDSFDDLGKR